MKYIKLNHNGKSKVINLISTAKMMENSWQLSPSQELCSVELIELLHILFMNHDYIFKSEVK